MPPQPKLFNNTIIWKVPPQPNDLGCVPPQPTFASYAYDDIIVIGKTGMGKSTTVDKMIIAKLREVREERSSAVQQAVPLYNAASHKLECEDLTMWMVSDKPSDTERDSNNDSFERITVRLKNLTFFRSLEKPHLEINSSRDTDMGVYQSTLECELLSNEQSKVRVLDVPGFFGREAAGDEENVHQRVNAAAEAALGNMRKVLRIKNAHNLKFRRVVYFLPEHGALKRTSQSLIAELQIMEKYFGRAIFDSMVIIATMSSDVYEYASPDVTIRFSEKHFEKTRLHLQDALEVAFKGRSVPRPPIEFISLFDTCENVLRKIQGAGVVKESVNLEFKSSVCARCGVKVVEEGSEPGFCEFPDSRGRIAYEESTCHPVMIPKYSKVSKVLGGVLHLLTLRRFVGKWPSFETLDEVCIACKQPPATRGCMKIGTSHLNRIVEHTSSAVETRIEMEGEAERDIPVGQGAEASIPVIVHPGSPIGNDGADNQFISQDGRHVFNQCASQPDKHFDIKG